MGGWPERAATPCPCHIFLLSCHKEVGFKGNREQLVIPSGKAFAGEKPSDGGKRVLEVKTEADVIRSSFGFCCMAT